MNRLSYPSKFLLISILFMLPLGVMLLLLVGDGNRAVRAAQREQDGVTYLRPLVRLLADVVQFDGAQQRSLRGDLVARGQVLMIQSQVDADLAELGVLDTRLGGDLQSSTRLGELRDSWDQLKATNPGGDDASLSEQQLQLIRRTVALIE